MQKTVPNPELVLNPLVLFTQCQRMQTMGQMPFSSCQKLELLAISRLQQRRNRSLVQIQFSWHKDAPSLL